MSFSVDVRLGEASATTSLSELSVSAAISPKPLATLAHVQLGQLSSSATLPELSAEVSVATGTRLETISFSANKDTELDFADTITFSVDNPDSSIFYYWEVENENGYKRALGQSVKQDYAAEGSYDANLIASNTNSIEGVNFKKDFVKVDFDIPLQLLDEVPGAAAAYSIRLLRQDYSDGLIRVRAVDSNGTDQGEADVQDLPFADGRYIDLNSPIENLDSTAQGRGLSNSDTLGDLVDSGGSNYDGFVPKWYEQSPNARHATNGTASQQPQIVNNGSILIGDNKPALHYPNKTTHLLAARDTTIAQQPFTAFAAGKLRDNDNSYFFDGNDSAGTRALMFNGRDDDKLGIFANNVVETSPLSSTPQDILGTGIFRGANSLVQINSGQLSNTSDPGSSSLIGLTLSGQNNDPTEAPIYLKELVFYDGDKQATNELQTVENKMNDFFNNIYF